MTRWKQGERYQFRTIATTKRRRECGYCGKWQAECYTDNGWRQIKCLRLEQQHKGKHTND